MADGRGAWLDCWLNRRPAVGGAGWLYCRILYPWSRPPYQAASLVCCQGEQTTRCAAPAPATRPRRTAAVLLRNHRRDTIVIQTNDIGYNIRLQTHGQSSDIRNPRSPRFDRTPRPLEAAQRPPHQPDCTMQTSRRPAPHLRPRAKPATDREEPPSAAGTPMQTPPHVRRLRSRGAVPPDDLRPGDVHQV